jgi:Aspartyl protease
VKRRAQFPVRFGWYLILAFCFFLYSRSKASGVDPIPAGVFCNVTFPQSATPDINTVYIPFTLVGQLMVVQARVDTVSGPFIVDTGSERLVMNSKHYSPGLQNIPVVSTGNTGLVQSVVGKNIDSLKVELLVLKNLFAHIVDLGHIEAKKNTRIAGILGYDVFKNFELFIDFPERRIVLYRLDRQGRRIDLQTKWELPADSINFSLKRHLIQVTTEINTVKVKMILDSGAELNLIDRHVNRKVLDNFTIIKRVNLVGVGQKEVEVLAGVLKDVNCGRQHQEKMNTLLTSLDAINNGFEAQADGVLGYEFLKSRRTLINYITHKIYFFNPVRP